MSSLKSLFAAGLLLASLNAATAQGADAQALHEAKLTLDAFGRGYAAALLGNAVPAAQLNAQSSKPRLIKLAHGEMSVRGSDKDLVVSELKLGLGDFRELGLQIGETPVEALIRNYGQPEKRDGRRLVYRGSSEICTDHLVFHIGNGVLQGIEWDWCYD